MIDCVEYESGNSISSKPTFRFTPPLGYQRRVHVIRHIKRFLNQYLSGNDASNYQNSINKTEHELPEIRLIDVGCERAFFFYDLKLMTATTSKPHYHLIYNGVDIDRETLRNISQFNVERHDRGETRVIRLNELSAALHHGSIWQSDVAILRPHIIVMIEVIEHIDIEYVNGPLIDALFGESGARIILITTPNADFNVNFGWDTNVVHFRHWDHRFEWTRVQFREWCECAQQRYPRYTFAISQIGLVKGLEESGGGSQMAVFELVESREPQKGKQKNNDNKLNQKVRGNEMKGDEKIETEKENHLEKKVVVMQNRKPALELIRDFPFVVPRYNKSDWIVEKMRNKLRHFSSALYNGIANELDYDQDEREGEEEHEKNVSKKDEVEYEEEDGEKRALLDQEEEYEAELKRKRDLSKYFANMLRNMENFGPTKLISSTSPTALYFSDFYTSNDEKSEQEEEREELDGEGENLETNEKTTKTIEKRRELRRLRNVERATELLSQYKSPSELCSQFPEKTCDFYRERCIPMWFVEKWFLWQCWRFVRSVDWLACLRKALENSSFFEEKFVGTNQHRLNWLLKVQDDSSDNEQEEEDDDYDYDREWKEKEQQLADETKKQMQDGLNETTFEEWGDDEEDEEWTTKREDTTQKSRDVWNDDAIYDASVASYY